LDTTPATTPSTCIPRRPASEGKRSTDPTPARAVISPASPADPIHAKAQPGSRQQPGPVPELGAASEPPPCRPAGGAVEAAAAEEAAAEEAAAATTIPALTVLAGAAAAWGSTGHDMEGRADRDHTATVAGAEEAEEEEEAGGGGEAGAGGATARATGATSEAAAAVVVDRTACPLPTSTGEEEEATPWAWDLQWEDAEEAGAWDQDVEWAWAEVAGGAEAVEAEAAEEGEAAAWAWGADLAFLPEAEGQDPSTNTTGSVLRDGRGMVISNTTMGP